MSRDMTSVGNLGNFYLPLPKGLSLVPVGGRSILNRVCLSQILDTHYSRLILLETFTCITFVKDLKGESANGNGGGWEIEREGRTGTRYALNFDASLMGLDYGLD
jgi:hypothetical protein